MFVFLLSLFILESKSFAYTAKEGNVSATIGPFYSRTNYEGSGTHPPSPILGGMGLIANGDTSDHGALEIAIFYMSKVYFREQTGDYLSERTQLLHITMGYRRYITERFSASLAFFSAYPMGDRKIVESSIAPGHELNTSVADNVKYGFDLSLQEELWQSGRYSVILDARYSLSTTSKTNEQGDHFGALIGVKYFIQEKQIQTRPSTSIPQPEP